MLQFLLLVLSSLRVVVIVRRESLVSSVKNPEGENIRLSQPNDCRVHVNVIHSPPVYCESVNVISSWYRIR